MRGFLSMGMVERAFVNGQVYNTSLNCAVKAK